MILTKLNIRLRDYGEHHGKYLGEASFTGDLGDISLRLAPEQVDRIFNICADSIISVSKEAARSLTVSVIEHQAKSLEAK